MKSRQREAREEEMKGEEVNKVVGKRKQYKRVRNGRQVVKG